MSNSAFPTLTLHRGFPARACYVWSPFCNKLEARLRMAGLPYKLGVGSPLKAPRGKIPYVVFDSNSSGSATPEQQLLGDSGLIVRKFVGDGHIPDLNAGLTPAERARDLAVRALLEDKLYFYQVGSSSYLPAIGIRKRNGVLIFIAGPRTL